MPRSATLGPASNTKETIQALFEAGADVFRLNFSHGSHADHQRNYEIIREIESELGRPIGILMDLQGPKLRLGTFADGPVTLKEGDSFRLDLDLATPGDARRAPLPHREIFAALEVGTDLPDRRRQGAPVRRVLRRTLPRRVSSQAVPSPVARA